MYFASLFSWLMSVIALMPSNPMSSNFLRSSSVSATVVGRAMFPWISAPSRSRSKPAENARSVRLDSAVGSKQARQARGLVEASHSRANTEVIDANARGASASARAEALVVVNVPARVRRASFLARAVLFNSRARG